MEIFRNYILHFWTIFLYFFFTPYQGHALCKDCFYTTFETEIHHTIISNKLFEKGEKVAIGASGGKGEQ